MEEEFVEEKNIERWVARYWGRSGSWQFDETAATPLDMAEQGDVSLLTFLLHITQFHAPFITGQYICILSFYVHDMYGKMIGEDAYNSLIIEFLRRNLP